MFIPIVPHTTVINKTIVYSDTVLNLKDLGDNIKVTSISNVDEFSFENCLKKVFESNPGVTFNTIQYSKENKKIYFYTNNNISTKELEDSKKVYLKPLSSPESILEEIKNVLNMEINKESDCISLYDVYNLIKNKDDQLENVKSFHKISSIISQKYNKNINLYFCDFDYKNKELIIIFDRKFYDPVEIVFSKNNNYLYIKEGIKYFNDFKNILVYAGKELSQKYEELMKYEDYILEEKRDVKSNNSRFLVDINHYGVDLFVRDIFYSKKFSLRANTFSYIYNENKYDYDCNSTMVASAIEGNEDEIFKRIFIKIEDCPKWSREALYEIRKNQLLEQEELEEERQRERQRKEKRKQKILAIKRKIFPFWG